MAEVTKRRLVAIYSMVAGFWMTLFSGHAHAWSFFSPSRQTITSTKRVRTQPQNSAAAASASKSTLKIIPSSGVEAAPPSNTNNSLNIVPSSGSEVVPAPDANKAINGQVMNVESVEDASMKNFMYQQATSQGKNPDQLSVQDYNTLRTDYLLQQVKNLEQQLQQLNGQNLSH